MRLKLGLKRTHVGVARITGLLYQFITEHCNGHFMYATEGSAGLTRHMGMAYISSLLRYFLWLTWYVVIVVFG